MGFRFVSYHFIVEVIGLEIVVRYWKLLQNPVPFRGPLQQEVCKSRYGLEGLYNDARAVFIVLANKIVKLSQ